MCTSAADSIESWELEERVDLAILQQLTAIIPLQEQVSCDRIVGSYLQRISKAQLNFSTSAVELLPFLQLNFSPSDRFALEWMKEV